MSSFDFSISLICASFFEVKSIKEGSFFFPRLGTGAKNGLSVSIKILSKGKNLNVFCNSLEFLNVIIPLAEKYVFRLSRSSANFCEPVNSALRS